MYSADKEILLPFYTSKVQTSPEHNTKVLSSASCYHLAHSKANILISIVNYPLRLFPLKQDKICQNAK